MSGRIPATEVRPGDVALFQGTGPAFQILSRVLKWAEPKWDRWGWHMAVVVDVEGDRALILEGTAPCSRTTWVELASWDVRFYRWLDVQVEHARIAGFVQTHTGRRYDVVVYVLTVLARLLRAVNLDFPRVINRAYTCWELVWEFTDDCGCEITDEYHYPLLTDFLRACGDL